MESKRHNVRHFRIEIQLSLETILNSSTSKTNSAKYVNINK